MNWSSNSVTFMNIVTTWFPTRANISTPKAAKSPILTYFPTSDGGDGLSVDSVYKQLELLLGKLMSNGVWQFGGLVDA